MALHGAAMRDEGYHILPIAAGEKYPGQYERGVWRPMKEWERFAARLPFTKTEIKHWSEWPGCGIGIVGGVEVGGFDIDVMDVEVADKAKQMMVEDLGDTPIIRIGQAPKILGVYRVATPFASIKDMQPVEFLGKGAQFVAYATHPGTGLPYSYPCGDFLDTRMSALPIVTEEQVRRCIHRIYAIVPEKLRGRALGRGMAEKCYWAAGGSIVGTPEAVEQALAHIPNTDLNYHTWIKIGHAIKGALPDHPDFAFQLWKRWSEQYPGNTPKVIADKWAKFKDPRGGIDVLVGIAMFECGWRPPSDLHFSPEKAAAAEHGKKIAEKLLSKASVDTGKISAENLLRNAARKAAEKPQEERKPQEEPEADDPEAAARRAWEEAQDAAHEAFTNCGRSRDKRKSPLQPPSAERVQALPFEAPGALGRFVDWSLKSAIRPQPLLNLGAALCWYGTLMGQRYHLDEPDTRSALYILG
ncbi:MAG: hypothetical protein K0S42_1518, partial [Microvirga sp.]|nr:hypothetical protein [Microvirga sp.]